MQISSVIKDQAYVDVHLTAESFCVGIWLVPKSIIVMGIVFNVSVIIFSNVY